MTRTEELVAKINPFIPAGLTLRVGHGTRGFWAAISRCELHTADTLDGALEAFLAWARAEAGR